MKAIRIDTFGGPEVMNVRDVDIPNPAPNEVLVRNLAVGVNPVDFKIRQGGTLRSSRTSFLSRWAVKSRALLRP